MELGIRFIKKVGEGAYGIVYKVSFKSSIYALKIEKTKDTLINESIALKSLQHPQIPQIIAEGAFKNYAFIILPYLKISITQIFFCSKCHFESHLVAAIAWNVVDILQYIHSKEMVYRDIKPENIMVGDNRRMYLVDFGMCIKKVDIKIGKIECTPRYSSINAHTGELLNYRDDLESLMYMIIYLLKGTLPWLDINDNREILESKKIVNMKELLHKTHNQELWEELLDKFMYSSIEVEVNYIEIKSILARIIGMSRKQIKGCSLYKYVCCNSSPTIDIDIK